MRSKRSLGLSKCLISLHQHPPQSSLVTSKKKCGKLGVCAHQTGFLQKQKVKLVSHKLALLWAVVVCLGWATCRRQGVASDQGRELMETENSDVDC
jgi:hypothetical protein